MADHNTVCPKCGGQAYRYQDEARRWRIRCYTCGFDTYLKMVRRKPKAL